MFTILNSLVFLAFYSNTIYAFTLPKLALFLVINSFFLGVLAFKKEKIVINHIVIVSTVGLGIITVIKLLTSDNFIINILGDYPNHFGIWMYLNIILFAGIANNLYIGNKKADAKIDFVLITLVIVALIGVLQFWGLNFFNLDDSGFLNRSYSTLGSPNGFGFLMTAGFLISLFSKNRLKFLTILFLIGLILSGSRAALLSLATGIAVIGIRNTNKKILFASLLLGLIGLVLLVINLRSIYSRIYIWKASLDSIFSNPISILTGNDFGSLQVKIYEYLNLEYFKYEPLISSIDSPHNLFIEIFYYLGLIGIILFCYWIYYIYKKFKNDTFQLSFLAAVLTFMFFNNIFIEVIIISGIILCRFKTDNKDAYGIPLKSLFSITIVINLLILSFYLIHDSNHYKFQENILSNTKSIEYVKKNMLLAPFYSVNQNYVITFDLDHKFKDSKYHNYISKNYNYILKKASDEELQVILNENTRYFNPFRVLELSDELKKRKMNSEHKKLEKYFLNVYTRKVNPKDKTGVDKANTFFINKLLD